MSLALTHNLIGKCICTDTEVRSVICKWMIYLVPGNTPGHHNVRNSVSLREHVLNLLAAPDVPVRYALLLHLCLEVRPLVATAAGNDTLTNTLHDSKCIARLKSLIKKIYHYIITTTDGTGKLTFTFLNKLLSITQPNVCTMRKSSDTNQVREALRIRIDKHLHSELSSELRNTEASQWNTTHIFWFYLNRFCTLKEGHNIWIIKWNILNVNSCKLL